MNEVHQVGPIVINGSVARCDGCWWLKKAVVEGGKVPVYDHECDHPKARFPNLYVRHIGRDSATPKWCPEIDRMRKLIDSMIEHKGCTDQ